MTVLAQSVWVERDGEAICLLAGSTPPAWAAALITNPSAWAEAGIPVEDEADAEANAKDFESDEDETDAVEESVEEIVEIKIPPTAGRGSSASAWAAYALSKGFAVEEDAKASEIREALAEAGIPVE